MDDNNGLQEDFSVAKNRSKRTKVDKNGRQAAIAKFKECRSSGQKYKQEISDDRNVYDEVDEAEYSEIVRNRLEDDWIVDDGSGYVEDGREIFDEAEDIDDASSSKGRKRSKEKTSRNPNIRAPDSKPSNIRSMFAAVAVKPKKRTEQAVSLTEDDLLGNIMAELKQTTTASPIMPPPVRLKKKPVVRNPFGIEVHGELSQTTSIPSNRFSSSSGLMSQNSVSGARSISKGKSTHRPAWFDNSEDLSVLVTPSQDIREFASQEKPEIVHASQKIEDFIEPSPPSDQMDLSGIDFDEDDFESEVKGDEQKPDKINVLKETKNGVNFNSVNESNNEEFTWNSICSERENANDIIIDTSCLPTTKRSDGKEVLSMYWIDAYEDYFKQPGVIHIFGKVWIESARTFVSCCVTVKNIERRIFVLPRKNKVDMKTNRTTDSIVTFKDVYDEINVIAAKQKIMKLMARQVTKSYAFEKQDVPAESEYLEVRYSADLPALQSGLQGETFSHIFGINTAALEIFLLDRKIKGPCWLDISQPQISNPGVTWCKIEVTVTQLGLVELTPNPGLPPPLVVMTMMLHTLPNNKTHQNEVIGVSCLIDQEFPINKAAPKAPCQQHFCAFTKPYDAILPFDFKEKLRQQSKMVVDVMPNERALLGYLMAKINKIDPDLLVGHDIADYGLDVLLHRITQNKLPHWSRIGRLKRATVPKFSGSSRFRGTSAACGRLVCDIMTSAKELIRCRSYDLTELVAHILKETRQCYEFDEIRQMFINSESERLVHFVLCGLTDATYVLRIMCDLNVIPLALQITNICGNVLSRTLMGGRSERNEFLLLHAFNERNFIVPDKIYGKKQQVLVAEEGDDGGMVTGKKSGRKKPAYIGGLVLEPKKGFYEKFILLLDFNSLYPSIIQEYNICFTTVAVTSTMQNSQEDDGDYNESLIPEEGLEQGVLPTEIRKLVQSRRQVRQLMKVSDITQEQYQQYDIRQKALKLTANSMYGCLGFSHSRFYAKRLAALVTGKGREILLKTKDLVQNMNLEVIYGDTDSIMVNSGCSDYEQVFKIGNKIKNEVNKLYRLLEIDIDGVFQSMLLLKKKKYAALSIQKVNNQFVVTRELKGLDIVRRDWCMLAKDVGNYVVDQILSGSSREMIVENIHSKLMDVGQKVKDGQIPLDLYIITKQLTKNPEDYTDKNGQPHVQVALRLNTKDGRKWRSGDTVAYIICMDGSNMPPSQRGYHPEELSKRNDLQIDAKYYLSQQLHPVVSRLCDPIDGTDAAHIAECLGLDASGYRHSSNHGGDEDDALLGTAQASDEERFKDCEWLQIPCDKCGKDNIIDKVLVSTDPVSFVLLKCSTPECNTVLLERQAFLQNKLTLAIRRHIKKYYEGWLKCDDIACGSRTRQMPLIFQDGHLICQACSRGNLLVEYTDRSLYVQLSFYQHLFDVERALLSVPDRENIRRELQNSHHLEIYKDLKCHVDRIIGQSAYAYVNLGRLFEGLFKLK